MDQDPNQFWSVAQEGWGKALAAFGQMGKADGAAPQLSFERPTILCGCVGH
jgi:hypothetical protein